MIDLAGAAEEVADTLFASADAVERAGTVSRSSLDLLAQHGFYGIAGPRELGGLPDRDVWHLVETIASGCLATAFVWIQHHSALRAVAASGNAGLQERWCAPMSRGQVRAGLALGGLRPGPATVRARREPGGYRLDGEAPWVTGWGLIDVVHVAARDEDDTIVWALLDAGAPLRAEVQDLVAVTASRTATVYLPAPCPMPRGRPGTRLACGSTARSPSAWPADAGACSTTQRWPTRSARTSPRYGTHSTGPTPTGCRRPGRPPRSSLCAPPPP